MKADPGLHERLERAASHVGVDTQRVLDRVHAARVRRERARRIRTIAVAAAVGLLAVVAVWQLRFSEEHSRIPGASTGPTGQIAYVTGPGESRGLLVIDAASGERGVLPYEGPGTVLWGALSPDGSRVAYTLELPGPRFEVVVSSADGSDPVTIADAPDTGAAGPDLLGLAWSPDGSRLAYSGRTLTEGVANRTVFIASADGSARPTPLDGHWEEVSWSPDGRRLLMSGFPGPNTTEGRWDLYTLRPDGLGLTQLTDDPGIEHLPSWSPDGSRITFSEGGDRDQDVYVMNMDGSGIRRLTARPGFDFAAVWSADGDWIAFASDRPAPAAQGIDQSPGAARTMGIWAMRPDGSDIRLLVLQEGALLYPTSWIP